MGQYVVRRMMQAALVVLGVTIIVFLLLHALPGGPVRAILGNHYSVAKARVLAREMGLNLPIYQQYWNWLSGLLHLNLGWSYTQSLPVATIIANALPNSLFLVGLGTLEALAVAIPLGIYQALKRYTAVDYVLTTVTFVLYSFPIFGIGLLAIMVFALHFQVFPVGGVQDATAAGFDPLSRIDHVLLPSFCLAVIDIAAWSRYMRSSMLDAMVQDYIRTARAKGLSTSQTVLRHALPNALIPIITLIGMSLPALFGGALVVEQVFNYPGIGYTFWNATQQLDFPTLLAIVLMIAVTTVAGNLLADILYAVVDPRVRYK